MKIKRPGIWKVAGLSLVGFCAISVAADRVNLGPIASEVAGFCGAFLGALAGRRSNQQQKFPPIQSTETKPEISEISSRIAPVGHSD
jgi:hypothetical protein